MARSKTYATENPAFTRSGVAGVEANHSSLTPSTENDLGERGQADEALANVPPPQDPNLSGMTPTKDCYPWRAGQLSAWQENDDYRTFFEGGHVAESSIKHRSEYPIHDGDYDDNRGVPTAIGVHDVLTDEDKGSAHLSEGTLPKADEFSLGPVIRRRI